MPDAAPLCATIIVLFCLAYFTMASIPFLFVRLDIPEVWRLFRGLFNVYFRVVGVVALAATAAFATSGHPGVMVAMLLLAGAAMVGRKTVLDRLDTQQTAWQSGDTAAMRRLRAMHWSAMLLNTAILATVAGTVPFVL